MVGSKEPVQQHHIGLTNKQVNVSFNAEESQLLTEGYELMTGEKKQTFRQAIRIHWRAAVWSFLLSWALVMEGYDGQLLSGFYGQRSFLQRFGNVEGANGKKLLSANIQAAIGNVGLPGNFLGLWFAGYGATRWGYRRIYIFGMVLMILLIFLFVFCQSLGMLIASQALVNIPWGIFQTLTTAYAAELCPIALRGYLTGFVVMAWNIGMFISALVQRGASEIDSEWAWRGPYAAQWFWPVPLLILAYFAPESPWHHIHKGEYAEAKQIVARLAEPGHYTDRNLDSYISYMKHTDDLDKAESAGGSWKDMFKGTNLRRTEIMFGVWGLQNWCGNGILGLGVELLETAGMSSATAYTVNVVTMAANIIAVACGWFLLPRFGRRPLFMFGLISLGVTLIIIGSLSVARQTPAVLYTQGAMMVVCTFWFQANINPLTYAIAGEIPATRLRPQAIAMGRAFYVVSSVPLYQLQPRMSSPKPAGWGWGTRCAWFWLGCNILCTIWVFFRLPETGGFTFAELDILFGNKVSARKFKHVVVHDELASGESKPGQEVLDGEKDLAPVEVQHLDA